MPPIRVLQVMPAMDAGGMETFVMNVYRTIDREKVQFIPLPPKEPAPQWPTAANSTTDNSVPFVVLTIIHL